MSIPKVTCPECGAGLRSKSGFTAGESVECPKCEAAFTVEEPEEPKPRKPARAAVVVDDDDDDDDRPRKKRRRRDDDDDDDAPKRSYKNSPIRFIILGVLIVIMLVLAYFLYVKKDKEAKDNAALPPAAALTA